MSRKTVPLTAALVAVALAACGGATTTVTVTVTKTATTSAGRLSRPQVQGAVRDASVIGNECDLEAEEQGAINPNKYLNKIIALTPKVNADEADLATLLQTDPDTKYAAGDKSVTMRELAANIAKNANAAGTGPCGDSAKNMQAAINGLPPS